jgi:hypothetical protein
MECRRDAVVVGGCCEFYCRGQGVLYATWEGEGGRRWEKVGEAVKDRYVCRR